MNTSDARLLRILREELTSPSMSDNNAAQMKICIPALEDGIDTLERQIPVFEAILNNLHRTLTVSTRTLALCRGVKPPIHRLPQELLVAVFQYCIPLDHDDFASLGNNVRWVLMRVCWSWKYILEGTPTLWTNLVISPDTRPLTQPLKLYLSLSAQHPLWITIWEHEDRDKALADSSSDAFWKMLSSTMHRWQRLRIHCSRTPIDDILTHFMPLKFPMLEEAYIWALSKKADPGEPSGQERSWFRNAPCLKRAMLEFAEERSCAWYPPSLTHMCTEIEDDMSMLEYALSFPNLQELLLSYEDCSLVPLPIIYHNTLTYLWATGTILRYLTLPSLKCLTLEDYRFDSSYPASTWAYDVTAFIHRSKCRLTDLRILATTILEEEHTRTELLPLVAPTLSMLTITSDGRSLNQASAKEIIRSLTRTESSPGSLPYLKHLEISPHFEDAQEDHDSIDIDSFVETSAKALISLCDATLAEQWETSVLRRVTVNSQSVPFVVKFRASCLDFLFSAGLEVEYGHFRGADDSLLTDWDRAWADRL
ncbi:hypothetical protein CYLTODRAFT_422930 [Cylindrobasidium torrendii FP15055 ss-10]|uniref:F-box domain-containing protein n=1 Tax=Cylindrobasidium torrendii FP15055 ss-10 TaxID=1314674 RepID=A0A0D7B919_9AGAR|nr:hypothetical protein CYLTODRAFT_422930 [Cylindrobasidium torrendii FP15055 ss-10]